MSDFNINDMRRMHWSQPIEQQTRDAIANMTDEQRMLETWLNDDPSCEGVHKDGRMGVCSVAVTHRFSSCVGVKNICHEGAKYVLRALAGRYGSACGRCDEAIVDHWRIRPI